MEKTIAWYNENRSWWQRVKSGEYADYYENQYARRLAQSRGA
jgi:dTDP-glucose 4,6-dehydratase